MADSRARASNSTSRKRPSRTSARRYKKWPSACTSTRTKRTPTLTYAFKYILFFYLNFSYFSTFCILQLDEQIEDLFKSKRTTKETAAAAAAAAAAALTANGTAGANAATTSASLAAAATAAALAIGQTVALAPGTTSTADKLKMAKGLAEKVSASRTAAAAAASNKDNADIRSILGGTAIATNVSVSSFLISRAVSPFNADKTKPIFAIILLCWFLCVYSPSRLPSR